MKDRFNQFMRGRYGTDDFSRFLLAVTVILMVVNLILRQGWLNVVVVALLIYIYIRMFSTNIQARYKENQSYLSYKNKVTGFFDGYRKGRSNREYHVYTCPQCKQKIRIPRGKGKIVVTCPKCRHEFTKRS